MTPDPIEQPWIAKRFEIQELIGYGGLGDVYRAWDHTLSRAVAVKRIKRSLNRDDRRLAEQTWREAMATASLQHPNIVTVYDFGLDDLGSYVVMEMIEGETLEQALLRGPFHISDFHRFASEALSGLWCAHHSGVVHRDIKPGNFMLQTCETAPFRVKILDFGLAKYLHSPRRQTVDHHNSLMGSIHYMAPEQFMREPIDQRTDLYSLGCIFYEVATGHSAFDGETIAQIMSSHISGTPHPIKELRLDLAPELERWIYRFIEKDPDDRFQTAKDALALLPKLEVLDRSGAD